MPSVLARKWENAIIIIIIMGKTPTLNKNRDLTLYILPLKSRCSFNRVSVSNLEVTDRQTDRHTLGIIILVKDKAISISHNRAQEMT